MVQTRHGLKHKNSSSDKVPRGFRCGWITSDQGEMTRSPSCQSLSHGTSKQRAVRGQKQLKSHASPMQPLEKCQREYTRLTRVNPVSPPFLFPTLSDSKSQASKRMESERGRANTVLITLVLQQMAYVILYHETDIISPPSPLPIKTI